MAGFTMPSNDILEQSDRSILIKFVVVCLLLLLLLELALQIFPSIGNELKVFCCLFVIQTSFGTSDVMLAMMLNA